MRCKPATRYLIQTSNVNSDTLSYELRLQNTTNITQQILLEIPIQLIDRISVQQLGDNDNTILKEYVFTSKKLSQRIYYDRNVMFPFDLKPVSTSTVRFKFNKNDIHSYFKPEMLIWKKDAKITRTEALEMTRGAFYGILILYSFICLLLTLFLNARN